MGCCIRKKDDNYEKIYENKSNIELEESKYKMIDKKNRNCSFAVLYVLAASGLYIATVFSGGISSFGTIPAGFLASVSAINSICKYVDNSKKIRIINNILGNREEWQIEYVTNKNGLTIITISPKNSKKRD